MEFTEIHAKQIQETHDAAIKLTPMIEDHHNTLYGNGQPGLVKDHLKFKTQVKTAIGVIAGFFTIISALIMWLK